MATVGTLTIAGNVSGAPSGTRTIGPVQILFTAAVDVLTSVALANGATTVTVPTGATCVVLFPPNAATPKPNPNFGGALTVKGISGDTGVPISNTTFSVLSWDLATAPANFVIASTASGTLEAWFA